MIVDAKELCFSHLIGKCRALCIDYGDKRTGVAISDKNWIIAYPLAVLKSNGIYRALMQIMKEYDVGLIVVGAPISLSGGESGKQLEKVKYFASGLAKKTEAPIIFWDERLSTHGAARILQEANIKTRKQTAHIDKIAAGFILEGFLNYCEKSKD